MQSDFSVAVHALVYLSVKGCTLSSDALADNICTHAARVRKVMRVIGLLHRWVGRRRTTGGSRRHRAQPSRSDRPEGAYRGG